MAARLSTSAGSVLTPARSSVPPATAGVVRTPRAVVNATVKQQQLGDVMSTAHQNRAEPLARPGRLVRPQGDRDRHQRAGDQLAGQQSVSVRSDLLRSPDACGMSGPLSRSRPL